MLFIRQKIKLKFIINLKISVPISGTGLLSNYIWFIKILNKKHSNWFVSTKDSFPMGRRKRGLMGPQWHIFHQIRTRNRRIESGLLGCRRGCRSLGSLEYDWGRTPVLKILCKGQMFLKSNQGYPDQPPIHQSFRGGVKIQIKTLCHLWWTKFTDTFGRKRRPNPPHLLLLLLPLPLQHFTNIAKKLQWLSGL